MKLKAPENCRKEIKEIIETPFQSSEYAKMLFNHKEEDLKEALRILEEMGIGSSKQKEINKELSYRNQPEVDVGGISEQWKNNFARKWNEIRKAAGAAV